jgi:hypothetical protein
LLGTDSIAENLVTTMASSERIGQSIREDIRRQTGRNNHGSKVATGRLIVVRPRRRTNESVQVACWWLRW